MAASRLLLVGQVAQPTGLARVVRELARGLSTDREVDVLGLDARRAGPLGAARVHACPDTDVYGVRPLAELLRELRPGLLLVVADLWIIPYYASLLESVPERPHLLAYVPIDAELTTGGPLRGLSTLSRLVLYCDFARASVERAAALDGVALPPIELIPHGVDCAQFAPAPSASVRERRRQARRELFPERRDLDDAFLILNANRNQPRKRLDLTLEAFARFARDKPPSVRLCLHTGLREGGCDILAEAQRLGVAERLLLTSTSRTHPHFTDHALRALYNACEVGLNTSLGEGWGLCSFEHAATAAAQIVPAHSACRELWEGAAELVPARRQVPLGPIFRAAEVDPAAVADAMERLYADPRHLEALSVAAYRRATRPGRSWHQVLSAWRQLLATCQTPCRKGKGEPDGRYLYS